jgi:preprotein translocase subunit YajC
MMLFCLLLPLMAMMYFDTLKIQKKAEQTQMKVEKLLKDFEKKDKE